MTRHEELQDWYQLELLPKIGDAARRGAVPAHAAAVFHARMKRLLQANGQVSR